MKNIAIFGSSRSGKSTLSRMISKRFPNYHIFNGDTIRDTFAEILPINNINTENGIGMKDDFPLFLSTLFYKNIEKNEGDFNFIVETCDILPQKAKELFDKENTIILFLGTPKRTVEYHFSQIRKYQTNKDWTYYRTDENIIEESIYWLKKSKEFENECKALNIWYVDTSFDRDNILEETLNDIEKLILI